MNPAQPNMTAPEEQALYTVAPGQQEMRESTLAESHMDNNEQVFDTQHAVRNTQSYESGVVPRRGETVMVAGEGCWMIDSEGRRYLDLTSSQGVAMLGYNHPVLTAALQEQVARLHACPNFFHNDTRAAFLEKLIAVTPPHLTHAFLANSGSEAIDGAIKFARLATGRTGIVAARNSFHGRTLGALSITWNPKYRRKFEPLLPDVSHIQFNNIEQLDAAVNHGTAAVVLEVIQAEGGVHMGDADFLAATQRLCRERGALLVIDEVSDRLRAHRPLVQASSTLTWRRTSSPWQKGSEAASPWARSSTPIRCRRAFSSVRTAAHLGAIPWRARPGLLR